ncbi:acyl-CoA carboxylase subunit epsilon [Rhodococcus sp. SBT000017]|uniref:acyl-CoA carboxylase subunit epsilon n=1 Tax=Rhodococcus sp. SBT000017 TaxID=1803385 RepID=UPI000EF90BB0|nr:acyl-CoA carboxylase subunit epsilon [Rhodococcus sp. SBT000017]RMB76343.1 acyl-CoA carboxylase subunit epsilon [Rhodococcus sp. SBT000017]
MSGEANHDAETLDEVVSPTPAAVRVVKGNPSDEELAALVTVLTAAQSGSESTGDSRPRELWGSPELLHRRFAAQSAYSYAASGRHTR